MTLIHETLRWKLLDNGTFDIYVSDEGNTELSSNYDNYIYSSIFTNTRATDNEIGNKDKQDGWWGTLINEKTNVKIGSKIWLLSSARNTENIENLYKTYIKTCLNWLVNEGYVNSIEINVTRLFLKIEIIINIILNKNEYYIYKLIME